MYQYKLIENKQNQYRNLNKKNNTMLSSLNYKSIATQPAYREQKFVSIPMYNSISIKSPLQMSIKIFQSQTNTESYCKNYAKKLLEYYKLSSQNKSCLYKHQITPILRARMLDWMVQVIESYKYQQKTYFVSAQIMDTYFASEQQSLSIDKLHIIGVVSMLIASKMEQVLPFRLETIFEKIVHKKISIKKLIEIQARIFQKLNFKSVMTTFYDKIVLQLYNYYYKKDNIISEDTINSIHQVCAYVGKFVLFDYEISTKFNKQIQAYATISCALQILNLKIPGIIPSLNIFAEIEKCKNLLSITITNYTKLYKGLNNIFKFSSQQIVKQVQQHYS